MTKINAQIVKSVKEPDRLNEPLNSIFSDSSVTVDIVREHQYLVLAFSLFGVTLMEKFGFWAFSLETSAISDLSNCQNSVFVAANEKNLNV